MSRPRRPIIFTRGESQSRRARLPRSSVPQAAWSKSGCTTDLCGRERTNLLSEINRWITQHLTFAPTCAKAACSGSTSSSSFLWCPPASGIEGSPCFRHRCEGLWFNPQVKRRADECILALEKLAQLNSGVPLQNVLQPEFDFSTLEVTFHWK